MTHVVSDACTDCKYTNCVEVCPVDCFYHVDLSDAQIQQIIQINQQFQKPLAQRKALAKQTASKLHQSDQSLKSKAVRMQKQELCRATKQVEQVLDQKRLAIRETLTPQQQSTVAQVMANRRNSDHFLSVWMPDSKMAVVL